MFTASYTSAAPEAVPSYIGIQIIAAILVAGATVILAPTSAAKKASATKK
jgi:hypothetical protein